jgi:hypothetical protein
MLLLGLNNVAFIFTHNQPKVKLIVPQNLSHTMFKTIYPFSPDELKAILTIVAPYYKEITIDCTSRDFTETTEGLPTGFKFYTYSTHKLRGPLILEPIIEFIMGLPENKQLKTITVWSGANSTEINILGRTVEVCRGPNPFTPEHKESLDIHTLTHIL